MVVRPFKTQLMTLCFVLQITGRSCCCIFSSVCWSAPSQCCCLSTSTLCGFSVDIVVSCAVSALGPSPLRDVDACGTRRHLRPRISSLTAAPMDGSLPRPHRSCRDEPCRRDPTDRRPSLAPVLWPPRRLPPHPRGEFIFRPETVRFSSTSSPRARAPCWAGFPLPRGRPSCCPSRWTGCPLRRHWAARGVRSGCDWRRRRGKRPHQTRLTQRCHQKNVCGLLRLRARSGFTCRLTTVLRLPCRRWLCRCRQHIRPSR